MSLEVELKAHVSDHALLRKRIEALPGVSPLLCELKEDTYFSHPNEDALFRVRLEQTGQSFESMQGTLVFTYKNKALTEGIEVNEEVEFSSSSDQGPSSLHFFLSLGYEIYITKTKRGYVFTYPVASDLPLLTVELVEIIDLGWFLELEFVLEEPSMVERARAALLSFLSLLGIDHASIESEYYMHLLKKKKPEA